MTDAKDHLSLLFLDFDGVLNCHEKLPGSVYCGIDRAKVLLLNRILQSVPDVQIVISSSWRYMILRGDMTVKGFEMLLLLHGVNCHERVHGHTCADGDIADEPDHGDREAWEKAGLMMRAEQIRQYVDEHKPRRFVVLDDLPLEVENFVQTDAELGLTDADAVLAIEILNDF